MKKIPEHIQKSIEQAAEHYAKANEQLILIKSWMEDMYGEVAINDNGIRDTIVTYIEQSNNPQKAIENLSVLLDKYLMKE
ncbi:hypothetical protein EBB07_28495 [Paenibacillaceae bacterium]|nr:hypothetical protein EBB07_28495 [Paenibacillaceae bacterium]